MVPGKRSGRRPLLLLALLGIAVVAVVLLRAVPEERPRPSQAPDEDLREARDSSEDPPPHREQGTIDGRVTRGGQAVSARVELTLFSSREPPHEKRETHTDSSGRFTLSEVPAGGHLISAVLEDGRRVSRSVVLRSSAGSESVMIEIPAGGHTLRGRVAYRDGRPFAGTVSCWVKQAALSLSVETDSEGRFEFQGLSPGRVRIGFRVGRDLVGGGPGLTIPAEGEVLLLVDEEAEVVRGRVVAADGGGPIAGAVVVTRGWTREQHHREWRTLTDVEGRFETQGLFAGGRYSSVEVTAPGYWTWIIEYAERQPEYEIRLERSAIISATVVSSTDRRPLPNVPVVMEFEPLNDGEDEYERVTDARGRALFDIVPAFAVWLSVRGSGWRTDDEAQSDRMFPLRVKPGEKVEVTLPAVRCARIEGRVVDSDGKDLAGASLRFRTPGSAGSKTLPQGRFVLDDLPDGDYTLAAHWHGLKGPEVSGKLASGDVIRVTLRLAGGAWAEVSVLEEGTGTPIDGASIQVKPGSHWRTNASGFARIGPLAPGAFEATVTHWNYRDSKAEFTLAEGTTPSVSVAMSAGLQIDGRIVLSDGTPIDRGRIGWYGTVVDTDGKRYLWHSERRVARVGEDGSFRLSGLPPGVLELKSYWWASGTRDHRGTHDVAAGTRGVELTIQPVEGKPREERPQFELILVDPSGSPVPMADYTAIGMNSEGEFRWEDSDRIVGGRAVLDLTMSCESLWILAHGARQPTGYPIPLGATNAGPLDPKAGAATIVLSPERTVSGFVRGPDGAGLGRVQVDAAVIWERREEPLESDRWTAYTAADGSFSIGGFGDCEVELVVDAPEGLLHPGPVRIPSGSRGIVITLDREFSVQMTVVDVEGDPVPGALVLARLTGLEGHGDLKNPSFEYYSQSARTDLNGVATLAGLRASGLYRFSAYSGEKRRDLAPLRIEDWRPRDAIVRLPAGEVVSGMVRGPGGSPVPLGKVKVWYWSPMGYWTWVNTTEGGRFEIPGLPEGAIGLTLRSTGAIHPEHPSGAPTEGQAGVVIVPAGTDGVVLEYPPRK